MRKAKKKYQRFLAWLLALIMMFTMVPTTIFAAESDADTANEGYDIATGDTDAQGSQRVRATNINIAGVNIMKHQKTGDFSATVLLPSDTDKAAELTFTLDCVAAPNMTAAKLFVNNNAGGVLTVDETDATKGKFVYSCVPEWNENGEASISFKTQWNTVAWVTKTYTLNLRILGEENTAPKLKENVTAEVSELIAVGESYTIKLDESAFWEDAELDDLTYTVSINGADPVVASGVYFQYGPEEPGETTLVFKAKDSEGNISEDNYTVKITAMNLTAVETGSAAVDAWNSDIKKMELGLADVVKVTKSEDEKNTWYLILDSATKKDAELFFRVIGSARAGRFQGVNINGKGVEGSETDGTNFIWTAKYTPEWNDKGEVALEFKALPQNNNKYIYTLKLKIANEDNKAPGFADGNNKADAVEQYSTYTVDVASLFNDADDNWLTYSVSLDGSEFVKCDSEYSYVPRTTGEHKLLFKATDITGAASEAFTLTLNVSEYEVPEGSYSIKNYKNDGALLSMTILNANDEKIEGVTFETDDSVEGTKTITVNLPGTMKTNDTVKASFHIVQNENGEPFLSTNTGLEDNYWNAATKFKTNLVTTSLSQAKGTATVYWYATAPTSDENNLYDTYVINYQIVRENNNAPTLGENVEASVDVEMNQYETWSLDLSTIFTDAESDELSYTVKVNEEEAVSTSKDYKYEAQTDEDCVLVFQATDSFGAVSPTYTVNLTVNLVHRHIIETGDPSKGVFGGSISYIYIEGQEVEECSYVKTDDTHRVVSVQLKDTVADDAEVTINWVDNSSNDRVSLTPSNPIKLVDGKATATIETSGNFFFKTHYYYEIQITNKENHLPTLAEGIVSEVEADRLTGESYTVDLSTIFMDKDGDTLRYSVAVDGADVVSAEKDYTFTPDKTGIYELTFYAEDYWGKSETYTVKLTVKNTEVTYDAEVKVPDAVTPEFYLTAGFDADGTDIAGDKLTFTKGESENGWTSYKVAVPENINRISFRGTDGSNDWGGMSIATEKDMEAVVLRQVQAVINTKVDSDGGKVGLTKEQAVFKVKYDSGNYAVSGSTGTDDYGYLYYRFLLVAADNSLIYTYYAEPIGNLAGSFATNQGDTKTITTDSAEIVKTVLPLATKNAFTITAPVDAEVEMFRQAGYFNGIELIAHETIDNNDGTKTVVFNNVGSKAMFRVSKEGEITKAGYTSGGEITIDWEGDDRGPDYRRDYATVTDNWMASRGDDSMYVNVNYRNNLQLDVDEEFQLRAYRIWEIIDTDTTNIMIEPDFHYKIISGEDVISVTPYDGCSGNAKNNWLDIKGLKEGTAVIEISYDAIDVISGDNSSFGNPAFTYNACDPARTALVVVQVGSEKNDIDFAIDANRVAGWDVEFDTLYFVGEFAELQFSPKSISGEKEIAKVEVSNDKGESYTTVDADQDGVYTAKIVSGNNILRVTTTDGTESYQMVRGDKIQVVLSEINGSSDQDGIMEAGEKINIQFKGVHNVIGKMSGIYNPTGYKTNFTYNGEVISGNGGQYTYPQAAYVQITLPGNAKDGDIITLTNGNTTNGGWGSAGGAHRAVTGEVPPNLNAGGITNNGRNIFPEITLTVGAETGNVIVEVEKVELDKNVAEVEVGKSSTLIATVTPNDATDKTITWKSSDDSVATVENGVVTGVAEGTVTITASAGEKSATCTVEVTKAKEDEKAELVFDDISEDEIIGYVTVSFEDNGIRVDGEEMDDIYKNPLGIIIEPTEVPFKAYDTIASVTLRLLKALNMTEAHTGSEFSGFYLSAIGDFTVNGIYYETFGEFMAGQGSGWMITWNKGGQDTDWFINKGASEFAVTDGDIIKWQYTCQLGADIGDDSYQNSVEDVEALIEAIGAVTINSADAITAAREAYDALDDRQKKSVGNYNILVAAEEKLEGLEKAAEDQKAAEAVDVLIEAIGEVTLESEEAIKEAREAYENLTAEQKVLVGNLDTLKNAEKVYAELTQEKEELEANQKAAKEVDKLIEAIGEVTLESKDAVDAARKAYEALSEDQKVWVENEKMLADAEKTLEVLKEEAEANQKDIENIYESTGKYLVTNVTDPIVNSIGGEWAVLGLARAGYKVPEGYFDSYVKNLISTLQENNGILHNRKYTEYSRVILALSAIGYDVTDVAGYNLLEPLADYDKVVWQGINGPIWALIALDSCDYEIPVVEDGKTQTTRENLLETILDRQLVDGGWTLRGNVSDTDMTAMAVQALAPYYETDAKVKETVDKALVRLSKLQREDGFYTDNLAVSNAESNAQVVVALTALGINPDTDERFVKDGVSVLDALCSFYVTGGGFSHLTADKLDGMATEQGYYALVSYVRMLNGQTTLYDMSDVAETDKIYSIISGADSTWKSGDKTVVIVSDGEFDEFKGIKVDGNFIDSSNYIAKEGSTSVEFKESYLKTLSVGQYTVTFVFDSQEVSTSLTIEAVESENPEQGGDEPGANEPGADDPESDEPENDKTETPDSEDESETPSTGDTAPIVPLMAMMLFAGITACVAWKKKRENA